MAFVTGPRVRRRRSSCSSLCCTLILAFFIMLIGFNIGFILKEAGMLNRGETVKFTEPPKPPNYYETLGVTPLVDEKTLKDMQKKFNLKYHPDKVKGDSLEHLEKYMAINEAYNTLTDGRLRCEYDKAHNIKGLFGIRTCRDYFRDEYLQLLREELDASYEKHNYKREQEQAAKKKRSPKKSAPGNEDPVKAKPKPKVKPEQQGMPKTGMPETRKGSSWETGGSGPAPAVPVMTAEPVIPVVIPVVGTVQAAVTQVWTDGIVLAYFGTKDTIAEYSESMFEFLGSFIKSFRVIKRVE